MLAKVSRATETRTVRIDHALIPLLLETWRSVLARTQYVIEVLELPDKTMLAGRSMDGTSYHFWSDDRSAQTHSPHDGTLLADVIEVGEDPGRLLDATPAKLPGMMKRLRERLGKLRDRLARNEACLAPSD